MTEKIAARTGAPEEASLTDYRVKATRLDLPWPGTLHQNLPGGALLTCLVPVPQDPRLVGSRPSLAPVCTTFLPGVRLVNARSPGEPEYSLWALEPGVEPEDAGLEVPPESQEH